MLGVISNSHGRADATAVAINIFTASGIELVVHCGDIGGRHILDALAPVGAAFVWGDRDTDRMGLLRHGQRLGIQCFGLVGELEMAGKRIVILHGDDQRLLRRLIQEQRHDYLLCGHELYAQDQTIGRTRLINPGPLHGGSGASAVVLDEENGEMRLLAL